MQLAYLPYLHLKDLPEIVVGNIKIWNFKLKADDYITDPILKQQIKKLLDTNVHNKHIIDDMGIVSIGNTDLREFNETELTKLKRQG